MPAASPSALESRAELLLATRTALRALPALYASSDAGTSDEAEVAAAELFCLLGLHVAFGPGDGPAPTREELVTYIRRMLESLSAATSRPRESWATVAAFGVRHGILYGGNQALTNMVASLADTALDPWNAELAHAAKQALSTDRESLATTAIEQLAATPLWPKDATGQVATALEHGRIGRARLRGWHGIVLRGSEWFLRELGGLISAMIERVGPPDELPGEKAIYAASQLLLERTTPREAAVPPAPPPPPPAPKPVSRQPPAPPTPPRPRSAPKGVTAEGQPGERVVNTGFSLPDAAEVPLASDTPLAHSQALYFWLEVGPWMAGSIETAPAPIPWEKLPQDAELTVALFDFGDGLKIRSSTGAIRLGADGEVIVTRQPEPAPGDGISTELLGRRLFFKLRTPSRGHETRLRCNIYCRQVLVQSRLVVARLDDRGEAREGALRSMLDYSLSRSLRPDVLEALGEHRLSVMLNDGRDGTHQFRFYGCDQDEFVNDASFTEGELTNLLGKAREALRQLAWGSSQTWNEQPYRYEQPPTLARLEGDLVTLAVSGFRFYARLADRLSRKNPKALRALMRRPGAVQFTARRSPSELVPAALIYDRLLDTSPDVPLTLCPAFREAWTQGRPLALEPCFLGDCPHADADTVVCPGGFWGFRHDLGVPLSLAADGQDLDAAVQIAGGPTPGVAVCVSTDPGFVRRAAHEARLRPLFGSGWAYADTRDQVKTLLRQGGSHLVYFYCHGGVKDSVPYLLVGNGPGITPDNILAFGWDWRDQHPLVFLNGCHTTALEPSKAFDLVTAFIETAGASAVIGTEITIFEPLACAFAEAFMREFVQERKQLGEAVRRARLALLQQGNPLGLVYIPFGLASLGLR